MTGTGVVFAALFVAVARAVWVVAGRIPSVGLTGLVRALAWLAGVGLAGLAVLLPFIGPGTMVSWSWVVVWPAAVVIALRWWSHLVRQTEA